MFPLHEQRILSQLITSWVQAVCERQPLGEDHFLYLLIVDINPWIDLYSKCHINLGLVFPLPDDICAYFGVKIAMYFAWLGFYTNSMLYPAVIGLLLWMLSETDQVRHALLETVKSFNVVLLSLVYTPADDVYIHNFPYSEKPRHLLCCVCPLQCHLGHTLPGTLEKKRSRACI